MIGADGGGKGTLPDLIGFRLADTTRRSALAGAADSSFLPAGVS